EYTPCASTKPGEQSQRAAAIRRGARGKGRISLPFGGKEPSHRRRSGTLLDPVLVKVRRVDLGERAVRHEAALRKSYSRGASFLVARGIPADQLYSLHTLGQV